MNEGDYVRTKYGKIGKIINISKNRVNTTKYLIEWGSCKAYYVSQVKDYKSSPNIIDLIEVGDYVNGVLVESIYQREKDKLYIHSFDTEIMMCFTNNNINSIVTKEQFESIKYEVN